MMNVPCIHRAETQDLGPWATVGSGGRGAVVGLSRTQGFWPWATVGSGGRGAVVGSTDGAHRRGPKTNEHQALRFGNARGCPTRRSSRRRSFAVSLPSLFPVVASSEIGRRRS